MAREVMVRRATEDDMLSVYEITHIAFAKYAYDLGVPSHVEALDETQDDILREIRTKYVLVAEVEGKIVACVRYFKVNDDIAYLSRFAVRPELQRSGVGKVLISNVEAGCRGLGVKAIALHTCAKMRANIRFYYAAGFYIYDVGHDRGYIRALLLKDLEDRPSYDVTPLLSM
jgi:N-acetylglutamate synthase-like GNAT family acetyltransferase